MKAEELSNEQFAILKQIRRWSNTISILGYIISIVFVILALSANFLMNFIEEYAVDESLSHPAINTVKLILIAILIFIPSVQLSRLTNQTKNYLKGHEKHSLDKVLKSVKSFLRYIGIVTIITLLSYILVAVALSLGYQYI
jgi:phosphatidylglycerophosphate synthase